MRVGRGLAWLLLALCCSPRDAQRPALRASPSVQPAAGRSPSTAPADFGEQVRRLWKLVACAPGWRQQRAATGAEWRTIEEHCRRLEADTLGYQQLLRDRHFPFLHGVRPRRLPATVVYPFSGGDLLAALTIFPAATEITTLSLEHGGDPRPLLALEGPKLDEQLSFLRRAVQKTFRVAHSTTRSLDQLEERALAGPLALALIALVVHEQEPVSLRYFRLAPDGTVRYLGQPDIAARESQRVAPLREGRQPAFSPAFSNLELCFRQRGGGPVRIYRHIAANLEDSHLARSPGLVRHLRAKGRIAAMTKAASYLLWRDRFSVMRGYLLSQADWIISDSSGPPIDEALAAGFSVRGFGSYRGAFLPGVPQLRDQELQAFWQKGPSQPLPFRFGYPDRERRAHLLIMARPGFVQGAAR